jgi:hypothetical protein
MLGDQNIFLSSHECQFLAFMNDMHVEIGKDYVRYCATPGISETRGGENATMG